MALLDEEFFKVFEVSESGENDGGQSIPASNGPPVISTPSTPINPPITSASAVSSVPRNGINAPIVLSTDSASALPITINKFPSDNNATHQASDSEDEGANDNVPPSSSSEPDSNDTSLDSNTPRSGDPSDQALETSEEDVGPDTFFNASMYGNSSSIEVANNNTLPQDSESGGEDSSEEEDSHSVCRLVTARAVSGKNPTQEDLGTVIEDFNDQAGFTVIGSESSTRLSEVVKGILIENGTPSGHDDSSLLEAVLKTTSRDDIQSVVVTSISKTGALLEKVAMEHSMANAMSKVSATDRCGIPVNRETLSGGETLPLDKATTPHATFRNTFWTYDDVPSESNSLSLKRARSENNPIIDDDAFLENLDIVAPLLAWFRCIVM
ncbi:MAG: hypothetical protein MMC33_004411 [Icmadophila ericetorum]|nr:hypothetical protein [Icmadophila ericetorum]